MIQRRDFELCTTQASGSSHRPEISEVACKEPRFVVGGVGVRVPELAIERKLWCPHLFFHSDVSSF